MVRSGSVVYRCPEYYDNLEPHTGIVYTNNTTKKSNAVKMKKDKQRSEGLSAPIMRPATRHTSARTAAAHASARISQAESG